MSIDPRVLNLEERYSDAALDHGHLLVVQALAPVM